MKKLKLKIKQLCCKHEYRDYIVTGETMSIRGKVVHILCQKCGKKSGEYFIEYEGNGYK